jgi:hypothetical protein
LVEQGNGEAEAAARDLRDDVKPAPVLILGVAGGVPGGPHAGRRRDLDASRRLT